MNKPTLVPATLGPVLEYVLKQYASYRKSSSTKRPMVIGISGAQGLGKTTLASALERHLRLPENGSLSVAQFSLDDVYKTHADQQALAALYRTNPLVQTRGQPGTHDISLCIQTLNALCGKAGQRVQVPKYNKAAFSGEGDREFEGLIPVYNNDAQDAGKECYLDVVIFEGWCVGFQSHNDPSGLVCQSLLPKSFNSPANSMPSYVSRELMEHPEFLGFVDKQLSEYQNIWNFFDVFVHLDAKDINWVYDWRLEQEHNLIREQGIGKTDQQVKEFIDGYMSSYYVYVPKLRSYMDDSVPDAKSPSVDVGGFKADLKVPTAILGERIRGHIRIIVNHTRKIERLIAM